MSEPEKTYSPVYFDTRVKAEDAAKYPDMRLRLLIRQAWLVATNDRILELDEALQILRDEADYLEHRI